MIIPLDSTWTLIVYIVVTLHKITWLLLTFHDYRCSLLMITHVLPGYAYHRHIDDHLYIFSDVQYDYTVDCIPYLAHHRNILWCLVLPSLTVHMYKATFECCYWPFTDARILDTPFAEVQNLFLVNISTELQTECRNVPASWYLWLRLVWVMFSISQISIIVFSLLHATLCYTELH